MAMTLHDNFVCDVCGKRRSLWNRRNLHKNCSKIRQERFNDGTTISILGVKTEDRPVHLVADDKK